MLYLVIKHAHSVTRWLLLACLLFTVCLAFYALVRKKEMTPGGWQAARTVFLLSQFQLLFGILLFLISPKVVFSTASLSSPILRFYLVEHSTVMLLATAGIMTGYLRAKKARPALKSVRQLSWYYLISLLLILAMIPWPFRSLGGQWF